MAKKYILYCGQLGNFQTRSMLIPYDEIMQCPERVADLQTLRDHSSKNVEFEHKGEKYIVDQVLYNNITWTNGLGYHDKNPYSRITSDFMSYADTLEFGCYIHLYDTVWRDLVIPYCASKGFNDVLNYCNFRNKTEYKNQPIEIVEGFLVLETNNGNPHSMPDIDTINEMYQKYYGFTLDDSESD